MSTPQPTRYSAAKALAAARAYAAPIGLILFVEIITVAYGVQTLRLSASGHFWIDEVLAVWVARLPTASDVTRAIWNGAEFSPPTYDLLLHTLFDLFGSSRIVARAPSILAVYGTALLLAALVWRHLGALSAALTFGLVLNSALFGFAIQARPYAMLTTLVAATLLLWSQCQPDGADKWRPSGICALLFASVSLHIYAIVTIAVFGLLEALWWLAHRRLRPWIWLAFVAAAAASTAWLPLILHLAAFNSGDVTSPVFYGAPTLTHLTEHVAALFLGSQVFALFILAALLVIGGAHAAAAIVQTAPRAAAEDAEVAIIGFALLAALPIGFVLALLVTHVFSARYALIATLGAILLVVMLLRRMPFNRVVGTLLCAVLSVLPMMHGASPDLSAQALALIQQARLEGPIVVSDGNLFLELMESADPALRSRLVHLTRPPGVIDGDTSAEHQVHRLLVSFRPDLPVKTTLTFMMAQSAFTDVERPGKATDALGAWFITQGRVVGLVGQAADVTLLKVEAGSSNAQHP